MALSPYILDVRAENFPRLVLEMGEVERCREQAPTSPWMDEVERCREQAPRRV